MYNLICNLSSVPLPRTKDNGWSQVDKDKSRRHCLCYMFGWLVEVWDFCWRQISSCITQWFYLDIYGFILGYDSIGDSRGQICPLVENTVSIQLTEKIAQAHWNTVGKKSIRALEIFRVQKLILNATSWNESLASHDL